MEKHHWLSLCLLGGWALPFLSQAENYTFDEALLLGSDYGQGLARFNREASVAPGQYLVDIWLNGRFIAREGVMFRGEGEDVTPCLPVVFYEQNGVLALNTPGSESCLSPAKRVTGASYVFDNALLRLDIAIPQAEMVQVPHDYVAPEQWQAGESLLFTNYNSNFYYSDAGGSQSEYGWLGLTAGINFGLWQLRQQSSASYSRYGDKKRYQWDNLQTWLQRPVAALQSTLSAGQSYSGGNLFSSMAFTGVKLETDQRMWPQSRQGYAPEIRGTAASAARVVVSQNGRTLYQTNVAQGPFVINDLASTAWQGDLQVDVIEADGSRSQFTVPFSALPLSLRPGVWRYNAVIGRARDYDTDDNWFGDFTLERGIANSLTANSGVRLGKEYASTVLGGVWASELGAIGADVTASSAQLPDGKQTGWRSQLSWSRSFNATGTNVALAGYRYSTAGYRDFSDVLGERNAAKNSDIWRSDTLSQRNQFTATVNQQLGDYGSIWLSGSVSDYYGERGRNTQLQFGYANQWRQISYNLAASRQQTFWRDTTRRADGQPAQNARHGQTENIVTLTFSVPLKFGEREDYLSLSTSHSKSSGTNYQASLAGSITEDDSASYAVSAGYQNASGEAAQKNWSASLQKMTSFGTLNGSYSQAENYKQWSGGMRGAAVVHRGGVTLGPWLGDTFALVEAKGAEGARVSNGQGAAINAQGFALVPSLTPYRFNNVQLDTRNMAADIELEDNQQRVAPYAGAAVKLSFSTIKGTAALIDVTTRRGSLPAGAEVFDEHNQIVGMVGQANQVYARLPTTKGQLTVRWGEGPDERCAFQYQLTDDQPQRAMIALTAQCSDA
ncbi:fimbria/pilus outer membrane usher protein [Buttiauxella agrestis]|uniref:fimbria/pilus outer membrane usher protein n=1 Tax=Buttiauxella agrestis TaxID=82977 RepID=UPI003974DCE6